MLEAIFNGVFAAAVVCSMLFAENRFAPEHQLVVRIICLVTITVLASLFKILWKHRKPFPRTYLGVPNLLVHIHVPSNSDWPLRWFWKGTISWIISVFSGAAGPEGAAAEWSYAARMALGSKTTRWSENRRRTDTGVVLSSALGAAFCTPFTAVFVPMEMGIGGRRLSSVLAAMIAFLGVREGLQFLHLQPMNSLFGALEGMDYRSGALWVALAAIGIASGLLSGAWIRFVSYLQEGLEFPRGWIHCKVLVAGIVLIAITWIYPESAALPQTLFSRLTTEGFDSIHGPAYSGILLASRALAAAVVVSGFGTVGIFWPLLALGAALGASFQHFALPAALAGNLPLMVLLGASSMLAATLGLPVSAATLVFELTGQVEAGLLCWLANELAIFVARGISPSLINEGLAFQGVAISEGRAISVLEALSVEEVMVCDHEVIQEKETLAEVSAKLLASRYPFLPVVRTDGTYTGMVTVDMVQTRLEESKKSKMGPSISNIFEVKDLLYRSGSQIRTVLPKDSLSVTQGLFTDLPCVPVLTEQGRVQGLLFVHHVRLAYEREVARRSLLSATHT